MTELDQNLITPYFKDDAVTIYHGDCRKIVPLLGRFDLLLTDPPYGIGASKGTWGGGGGKKNVPVRNYGKKDWDNQPVAGWLLSMLIEKCGKAIIFGGNYYSLPPCKGPLVWDKENTGDFADGEMAWNNLGCPLRIKRHRWNGMVRLGNEPRDHPTQKPLDVIRWCIDMAGDVDTILDPFAGSGTTGRAAKDMGKRAVLIEQEESYCEIAAKRLSQQVLDL